MPEQATFYKHARSNYSLLDYVFDWAARTNGDDTEQDWLGPGETIESFAIDAPADLIIPSKLLIDGNTAVRVWVDMRATMPGEYKVICSIKAAGSEKRDARELLLRVK